MVSFYPGPSRVYDDIARFVQDAHRDGILSMNHRSLEFENLMRKTIEALKRELEIPASCTVVFASSATECWEIIAQSLVKQQSTHIYNGAFGQKWFQYTQRIVPASQPFAFHPNEELNPEGLQFPESEVICLTQNETSNGTQVSNRVIGEVKKRNPHALIAVDATSSMAGVYLNFKTADVWFASVQKCFGLPAGLAVMICSSKAVARAMEINEREHYNSLVNQLMMVRKFQTTHTPNVLGMYLLYRVMKKSRGIHAISEQIKKQASGWYRFFEPAKNLKLYIGPPAVRSDTVITVAASAEKIKRLKTEARQAGFTLGSGYGELKEGTFRIANFPAITSTEIKALQRFFRSIDW